MNRQGGSNNLNDPKDLKDLNDPKDLNKIKKGCKRCACSLEGGGYLLSHFRSTIGVAGFNFSVRNGKRWNPRAITTLIFVFSVSLRRRVIRSERTGSSWSRRLEAEYG